jgi:hypothetical protein
MAMDPGLDGREMATVVLSGAILVIGIAQLARAAAFGGGPIAWVIGLAFVVAGAGRLWLWWRQRAG